MFASWGFTDLSFYILEFFPYGPQKDLKVLLLFIQLGQLLLNSRIFILMMSQMTLTTISSKLQLLVNPRQFSSQISFHIIIFRIECFLKRLLCLSQVLNLYLIRLYACIYIVQLFLYY